MKVMSEALIDCIVRESGRIGPEIYHRVFNRSPWVKMIRTGIVPVGTGVLEVDNLTCQTTELAVESEFNSRWLPSAYSKETVLEDTKWSRLNPNDDTIQVLQVKPPHHRRAYSYGGPVRPQFRKRVPGYELQEVITPLGIQEVDFGSGMDRSYLLSVVEERLNSQQSAVIKMRFFYEMTYKEIANSLGLFTAERVRQIEAKAMRKLRNPSVAMVLK